MEYFKTTTITDEVGEVLFTGRVEVSADEVIQAMRPVQAEDVFETQRKVNDIHKVIKVRKPYTLKEKQPKAVKKERRGKAPIDDSIIYRVLDLKKEGAKTKEIVKQTGVSSATVYRITSGAMKPSAKRPTNSPTATKWGEREIDKGPERITGDDFLELKTAHDDGQSLGSFKFSMPQYDLQEMKRAVEFDTYEEYAASRK